VTVSRRGWPAADGPELTCSACRAAVAIVRDGRHEPLDVIGDRIGA
jgi:hypothetical protein